MTFCVREEGIFLTRGGLSATQRNIAKVLDFFAIAWSAVSVSEFLGKPSSAERPHKVRLSCSSDTFLELITTLEKSTHAARRWRENVHSVFIHPGDDNTALEKLASLLTRNPTTITNAAGLKEQHFAVADDAEICGAMAGIRIKSSAPSATLFANANGDNVQTIVSLQGYAALILARYQDVPIWVTSASEMIDLEAELPRGVFDIRQHALSALPVVLYSKWAFARTCWQPAETSACLIIDDPLLKRSHGFVDFSELLSLMKRHHFSTNIAFIPWNWRRSHKEVVRLFLQNPDYYSISVHGCDHTPGEFGKGTTHALYARTRCGLGRMAAHEKRTGIGHDRVMVFPQGVFSTAAMTELKRTELLAAVNNDTISTDAQPPAITMADAWDVAVMKYGDFPLFTRRYPWEGIENFAFDALLGKPILIVIHHESCRDHCQRLVEFIDRLNLSRVAPHWRNLSDLVQRSYRQRSLAENALEVEMYATRICLTNHSAFEMSIRVNRRENDPSSIKEIRIGSQLAVWAATGDRVSFNTRLQPNESTMVQLIFDKSEEEIDQRPDAWAEARVMLRRYVCEVRDNYVTRGRLILASAIGRRDNEWN